MKKITHVLLLILFSNTIFAIKIPEQRTSLSGKISDKQNGQTLPGVSVYFPDLKTGAVSDVEGNYFIDNLPAKKMLLQVSFVGYKTIIETIDLSQTTLKDFVLEISVKEMNEVIVTGHSQAGEKNRTPTPISSISKIDLLQNSSSNIIDAITKQPGIDQITTGAGISKPVIRGLGYNRVVVVNDGIRQEGQQWGDEHGVEIDEFTVNKIEILKGPASLSYGSDAIAGVVNMISETNIPQGKITGGIIANYQTNNGAIAYSGNLAGNVKGVMWNFRYSNKMAHAYQNKYDGYVYNSGFKENTVSGILGLNKPWGYSHLHFSIYDLQPGLIEGERDSTSGKFIRTTALNDSTEGTEIVSNEDLQSYEIGFPHQKIHHAKVLLNNNIFIGNGSLKIVLGFQQNQRKEFGNVLAPEVCDLYFLTNTINYDLRYVFPEKNNWDISFGVNGMQQTSQNKGIEFLIPEYQLFDIGGFVIAKKSYKKFDFSGGLRFDVRSQQTKDLYLDAEGKETMISDSSSYHQFKGMNYTFSGLSGSIGATYQFSDKLFAKANVAQGYRAPNIAELSSNGVHEGTLKYELGNSTLKPETSQQFDLGLGLNTEHISAEVDFFMNSINNFIFSKKLNSYYGGDSVMGSESVFQFDQGNALLIGEEIIVDIHPHPLDWLHFENSFSFVYARLSEQADSLSYLPMTPPAKLRSDLKADIKKTGKIFSNVYFKIGIENYFAQNNIYSAYGTETATPGFFLLNAGLGTDITRKGNTVASIFISGNNLTDTAYQSHLSRLKYAEENNATGRKGVFNMGRNISFKVLIPLSFKK